MPSPATRPAGPSTDTAAAPGHPPVADWHVVVDGVHQAPGDDFVFVHIRVTSETPPPGPMRSDLGDHLAEVIRANWPQGGDSEPASRVKAGGNGGRRSFGGGAGGSHAPDVVITATGSGGGGLR